ncbi:MAG: ATP-binding protein [Oscillibacter sp.]|nr:ATP-binding protein [Oscillibacter sp.]
MPVLRIAATRENAEEVMAFVDGQLEAHDCSPKAQTQLDIAVDELFTNIASYAYGAETGEAVIEMEFPDGFAEITFRDWGTPYNPLARPDPDVTLPAEERQIGGLGIYMVKKSMDAVSYRYEDGQNILTVRRKL